MIKSTKNRQKSFPTTSRQAVEAAIDSSKAPRGQSWDEAAEKSRVSPWSSGTEDKEIRRRETIGAEAEC